eukprot:gene10705-12805_t
MPARQLLELGHKTARSGRNHGPLPARQAFAFLALHVLT